MKFDDENDNNNNNNNEPLRDTTIYIEKEEKIDPSKIG